MGCDELLNSWCDACCPPSADDPLLARKLTETSIKLRSGDKLIFWGCFPYSELTRVPDPEEPPKEWSSKSCGIMSEREPGLCGH